MAQQRTAGLDSPLYGVYRLSPKTVAVTIHIFESETHTYFDSLFLRVCMQEAIEILWENNALRLQNCEYYDTTGAFFLYKNKALQDEIKTYFDSVFVYGTRGVSRVKIKDVAFVQEECRDNFIALTFNKFDTVKYGQPLFCSKKLMKLNYNGKLGVQEKKIIDFETNRSVLRDTIFPFDMMKTYQRKVFAYSGNTYFTYNDDFNWHNRAIENDFLFPLRAIYTIKGDEITCNWLDVMDLSGYTCY